MLSINVLGLKRESEEIYFLTRYSIILRNVAKGEFSNVTSKFLVQEFVII